MRLSGIVPRMGAMLSCTCLVHCSVRAAVDGVRLVLHPGLPAAYRVA